jgi:hypothetical protein
MIRQTAQEGLGVGGQVIAQSEMPEIGHSVETSQPGQVTAKWEMPEIGHSGETSQAGEEDLGAGGQVVTKWEMPEIGHSGETSQAGEGGWGVGGQVVVKWEMPEIGQSDVETSQPVTPTSIDKFSALQSLDFSEGSSRSYLHLLTNWIF